MALVQTIYYQELSAKHYQLPTPDMEHLTGWEWLTQTTSDGKPPRRQVWSDASNSAQSTQSKEWALIPQTVLGDAVTQIQDLCSTFLFWMRIKKKRILKISNGIKILKILHWEN